MFFSLTINPTSTMNLQLKFYADSADYKNKLFTFNLTDVANFNRILAKFIRSGNKIRAAFIIRDCMLYRINLHLTSTQQAKLFHSKPNVQSKVQSNKIDRVPEKFQTLSIKQVIVRHRQIHGIPIGLS